MAVRLIERERARNKGLIGFVSRMSSSPLFTRSENVQKLRWKKVVNRASDAKKIPRKKNTCTRVQPAIVFTVAEITEKRLSSTRIQITSVVTAVRKFVR